jgi:hypothetical protein
VREWTDVVRRARLGRTVKGVAFVLASYADFRDGTRIRVGLAKLAVAAEVEYKTAKKAVAALLQCGLIVPAGARSGVRLRGTEYRLALAEDLLDRLVVLSPAQLDVEADRVGAAQRRSRRTGYGTARPDDLETPEDGPPDTPSLPPDGTEGRGTARPQQAEGRGTARPQDGVRRSARTSKNNTPLPPPTPTADVRTAVTASRARAPDQDPNSTSQPDRCGHGLKARLRPDGSSSCALCRKGAPPAAPKRQGNVVPFPARTA